MAKVIYLSGNYVVVTDANNVDRVFPIGMTVYEETAGNFLISEGQVEREQLIIPVSDAVNWVDNDGTNYTESTLRDFLRTNTGSSSLSSGGGGGASWGDITGTLSDQTDLQSELDDKQDTLVSATNIKTINGASVLGSGDLTVGGGSGIHTQMLPGGSFMGGLYTSNRLFGGSNYNLSTYANNVIYVPFIPNNTFTTTELNFFCLTGSAGDENRICIYSHNGINMPQDLLYESADIDMSTSGTKTVNVTRNWTKGEVYWFAICQKNGGAKIMGMGGSNADSLIIGLVNTNYFTMYRQTFVTYTNGAPTTANPNSNLLDPYLIYLK